MSLASILKRITPEMLNEHWDTVTGTEHELGVINLEGKETFNEALLPSGEFVKSGARIYLDMGHPEMSTPEASNPFQLAAVERALTLRMLKLGLGVRLYKNTGDFRGGLEENNTFSAHENYFTCASREDLLSLVPFLVSRIIFTGSGDTSHGEDSLFLSQRAPHIVTLQSVTSTFNRGLLDSRDEPLSNVPGWYRLHHLTGDGNMCPAASLLKHGTFMLLLRLLENGELDPLLYDEGMAIEDLHEINQHTKDWELKGTVPKPMRALDVQGHYLNCVASKIKNPSPLERIVIDLWGEVLHVLEVDPTAAAGVVDWATKALLFEFNEDREDRKEGEVNKDETQSLDLEYHNIDPSEGIFYSIEELNWAPSILPKKWVEHYIDNPPKTTRAYFRGEAMRLKEEAIQKGKARSSITSDWDSVSLFVDGSYREDLSFNLPDPRGNYERKLELLKGKLGL